MIKHTYLLFVIFILTACGTVTPPCPPPDAGEVVYVTGQGWHVEIGIPVEKLSKDLSFYRKVFPGAHVVMFGYGKKTFFTAPPDAISEYFLGPVPGPAVIQVVGLKVTPMKAYPENTIVLSLPRGGSKALSSFIWNDLTKDQWGKPIEVSHSTDPVGTFYRAESEYNLFHTCNTWIADALYAAGLPVSGDGVIFSGQTMTRVEDAAAQQCR